MNKDEITKGLSTIINTVNSDLQQYEQAFISGETYSDTNDCFVNLDETARIILLEAMRNHDHIMRELCKLTR